MKNRGLFFWLVVGGVGLFVLGLVAAFAVLVGVVNSDASKAAERFAQGDPAVTQLIGDPMSIAWLRDGSIETNEHLGAATFTLTASGPRGEALVRVLLVRTPDGDWEPVYGAVVDGDGRPSVGLDASRVPAVAPLAKGIREKIPTLPGTGVVAIKLDGGSVKLLRGAR